MVKVNKLQEFKDIEGVFTDYLYLIDAVTPITIEHKIRAADGSTEIESMNMASVSISINSDGEVSTNYNPFSSIRDAYSYMNNDCFKTSNRCSDMLTELMFCIDRIRAVSEYGLNPDTVDRLSSYNLLELISDAREGNIETQISSFSCAIHLSYHDITTDELYEGILVYCNSMWEFSEKVMPKQ